MKAYEPVIGLEVHCQLATESKVFCTCRARISTNEGRSVGEERVNIHTCPICGGHPGTLPVLNKKAVEFAIKAGLALQCRVHHRSVFSRKNYFYPDLPKGYQITQFDLPICEDGVLEIELKSGEKKKIGIQRIHIEEDAGKNIHMEGFSVVNLNRAGVPLIEIVSKPDLRTPEEAGQYLRALYAVVTYLGICDGNLQEGNFRCDANVSVRPVGSSVFGVRAEVKNVNSFRFVEKAIEFEIGRQIEVLNAGGKIIQETRGYDSAKNKTFSQRSKEEAQDYRYFPEPDLIPLLLDEKWIREIKLDLVELPHEKKARWISEFGLSSYDAGVLTASKELGDFFEACLKGLSATVDKKEGSKITANLLTGEVSRLLNEKEINLRESKLLPKHIAELVEALTTDAVSSTAAKSILAVLFNDGGQVASVTEKLGLQQVSDEGALEKIIEKIIQDHPSQVADFRSGKDKLFGFFVGQAMKAMQGKANPKKLQELLTKKLSS